MSPAAYALIERCRLGDAGGASAEFAKWSARRVAVEASVPTSANDETFAAMIVLHTGTAILSGAFGGANTTPRPDDPHFAAAHKLTGVLAGRARNNPVLREFCSSWYVLAASLWNATAQFAVAERTLRSGHGPLGEDPEFLLAAATVDEARMGPYSSSPAAGLTPGASRVVMDTRDMKATSWGYLTSEYLNAERRFRKALALRPDLVEARLRLGRVLSLLDRPDDARRELEQVLADASASAHPFARAMAALFLGQLHQHAGRLEDAGKAYDLASSIRPTDQAPRLALGHLLVAAGRADEGWAIVRLMLESSSGTPADIGESFRAYRQGQYWQAGRRLARLEAWVRR